MSDDKPPMPPQPTTKQLPAMTDRALLEDLARSVKDGFSEVRADLQLVSTDVSIVKERVRLVEDRLGKVEGRQDTSSFRVKAESSANLQQDSAIASIVVEQTEAKKRDEAILAEQEAAKKRDEELSAATAAQTAILDTLERGAKAVASNPHVRLLFGLLWTGLLGYLASKGFAK